MTWKDGQTYKGTKEFKKYFYRQRNKNVTLTISIENCVLTKQFFINFINLLHSAVAINQTKAKVSLTYLT
jgi:hypothetical protein